MEFFATLVDGSALQETLDAAGKFKIEWLVDDNDVLELQAVVETTGWIALGISPNGLVFLSAQSAAWRPSVVRVGSNFFLTATPRGTSQRHVWSGYCDGMDRRGWHATLV